MREIKFRVWDNVNFMSSPFGLEDIQSGKIQFTKECIVMQFTGLYDKNGKGIYECDIVSHHKRIYEVAINFNGFYLQRYKLWRGKFEPSFQYSLSLFTLPSGEVKDAEVIGNTYENTDLIDKIKDYSAIK